MKNYDNTGVFLVKDKITKQPLYFSWKFDDGTTQRVAYDPNEEWCTLLGESLKEEHAQDVKEQRHRARFHKGQEIDIEDLSNELEEAFNDEKVPGLDDPDFLATLTPVQLRRFRLLVNQISLSEIAKKEGVDVTSIRDTFECIKKKYLTFLANHTPKR